MSTDSSKTFLPKPPLLYKIFQMFIRRPCIFVNKFEDSKKIGCGNVTFHKSKRRKASLIAELKIVKAIFGNFL